MKYKKYHIEKAIGPPGALTPVYYFLIFNVSCETFGKLFIYCAASQREISQLPGFPHLLFPGSFFMHITLKKCSSR